MSALNSMDGSDINGPFLIFIRLFPLSEPTASRRRLFRSYIECKFVFAQCQNWLLCLGICINSQDIDSIFQGSRNRDFLQSTLKGWFVHCLVALLARGGRTYWQQRMMSISGDGFSRGCWPTKVKVVTTSFKSSASVPYLTSSVLKQWFLESFGSQVSFFAQLSIL